MNFFWPLKDDLREKGLRTTGLDETSWYFIQFLRYFSLNLSGGLTGMSIIKATLLAWLKCKYCKFMTLLTTEEKFSFFDTHHRASIVTSQLLHDIAAILPVKYTLLQRSTQRHKSFHHSCH